MKNWIGKKLIDIAKTSSFKKYFENISIEKGIDVHYLCNSQRGIDIILYDDYIVKAIHLYSGKQDGSSQFIDELPFNLSFDFSRNYIRSLLGNAMSSGGGDFIFLYGTTPLWDKYQLENCVLPLQYSSDEKKIELITVDAK